MKSKNLLLGGTWVKSQGIGEPIILIHGVGLDQSMWKSQVIGLQNHYNIITYDLIGHGNSINLSGERSIEDFVDQLFRLMINLKIKCASILGFSMGGLISHKFTLRYPKMTKKLILMNTVFKRSSFQQQSILKRYQDAKNFGLKSQSDDAIKRWFSPKFIASHSKIVNEIKNCFESNDPNGYLKAYKVFSTFIESKREVLITCPTLILTGEFDRGSTPNMAHALGKTIIGSKVKILRNLSHMMPVEDPSQINFILKNFLENADK